MNTINMKTTFLAILLIAFSVSYADTMHSTAAGGNWHDPATWEENLVPGADDDVVIAGPGEVLVYNSGHECNNLIIQSGALLRNRNSAHRILDVRGDVINLGTITNAGSWDFTLRIEGDIENYGIWESYSTR
ncbi:MAG: hypothetical protein KDC05_16400, partial [Bacteroidales bacterium]|nr:hypothetical protein [Bacteroidales bacterium]